MRDPRIQVHPEVEDSDLIEIVTPIAQDNPTAADAVYNSIWDMFVLLSKQPMLGTDINPMRRTLRGIRMVPVMPYRNYLVYYRPLPEKAGVRILYALHAARDAATFAREFRRQ